MLIEKGANVKIVGENNETALSYAVAKGIEDVLILKLIVIPKLISIAFMVHHR